jgi:hypothetical protein
MKVYLESNFLLLGSGDVESMDFERSEITLIHHIKTLAKIMSKVL